MCTLGVVVLIAVGADALAKRRISAACAAGRNRGETEAEEANKGGRE